MANSYRALTRTYRPQVFEDVVSQEHVSSTLKNAIAKNRLSHAYMFCGPRGVGKTTMARVLARAINQIDDKVDGESLSQTLNVVEIDAASNNKVEDIHHLREIVRVPPQSGRYKIFIIDEVHMLSKAAFNALLKTLEEPPPHAIFIFATTEPHKVLPTILSRVQRFDFKRIGVDEIVERLETISKKEGIVIDRESMHTIARKADGALRDALGLMDQAIAFCGTNIEYKQLIEALNVVGNDQLFEFTDAISDQNADTGLKLIDRLLKEGIDIQEFLVSLTAHIRNFYVAKQSDRMYLVEATEETKQRYIEKAKEFSESDLLRMLHLVSEAQIKIRDVQQPKVHFEILMLKLIHMGRSPEIQTLLSGLEALKKKSNKQLAGDSSVKKKESNNGQSEIKKQADQSVTKFQSEKESGKDQSHDQNEAENQDPGSNVEPLVNESKSDATRERDQVLKSEKDIQDHPIDKNEQKSESTENTPDTNQDFELVMGKPSLGAMHVDEKSIGNSDHSNGNQQLHELNTKSPGDISDIRVKWPAYLSLLEKRVSKTIFHQLENVRLKDLKGADLYLAVTNVFAVNIVEENKQVLAELLKEVVGVHLRFKCVVERDKSANQETKSPYERFKEVQQKDPHLSSIVELFGAEVEY